MSRSMLATRLGLDYTTINKIELGKTADPRYSTVTGLAEALGVSPDKVARAILASAEARTASLNASR